MKQGLAIAFSLLVFNLFSSEHKTTTQTSQYDAEKTMQLENLVAGLNESTYSKLRPDALQLITTKADPNVSYCCTSLLKRVVIKDDVEGVKCCLAYGADADPRDDIIKPVESARSVAVLKRLLKKRPDLLHRKHPIHGSLLHNATCFGRDSSVVAYLCNAGLNPNEQDRETLSTPLHNLFHTFIGNDKLNNMKNVAALTWCGGASSYVQDKNGKIPLEVLNVAKEERPRLEIEINSLISAVLFVKMNHEKSLNDYLTRCIGERPAYDVMTYMYYPWTATIQFPWSTNYWPEINRIKENLQRQRESRETRTKK